MASKKAKYYVVWTGAAPGIYRSWADCEAQVKGVAGALYKGFDTEEEAEEAFYSDPSVYVGKKASAEKKTAAPTRAAASQKNAAATQKEAALTRAVAAQKTAEKTGVAVDAACSGNPGPMEYRGVYLLTGQELFHYGPAFGTNNIGEFLAIVHALALLKSRGAVRTVYSDSRTALSWVRQRRCKTNLARTPRTSAVFALIDRAEAWLAANDWSDIPIRKWPTEKWGEIPADFGRK